MPIAGATSADSDSVRSNRGPQACVGCRSIKTRCLVDENGDDSICQRCGLSCEFTSKRRGRKTNAERAARAATSAEGDSLINGLNVRHTSIADSLPLDSMIPNNSGTGGSLVRIQHTGGGGPLPEPPLGPMPTGQRFPMTTSNDSGIFSPTSFLPNHQPQLSASRFEPTGLLSTGMSRPAIGTSPASERNESNRAGGVDMDISRRIDPSDDGDASRQTGGANHIDTVSSGHTQHLSSFPKFDDPVSLGFLSEMEAQQLITLFYKHLNVLVNIADPKLHTYHHVRNTSSALFTMMLAASSKFFRPNLYLPLLSHGQTLINRAISSSECDGELVQALAIAIYWKEPADKSVWIKIGIAIRIACQLGWHTGPERPLPQDEMESRKQLAAERVWFCLACFDMTYSDLFRLPRMMRRRDIGDATVWALDHLSLNIPTDIHLACSVDHVSSVDLSEINDSLFTHSKQAIQVLIDQKAEVLQRLARKWFAPDGLVVHMTSQAAAILRWLNINRLFKIRQIAVHHEIGLDPIGDAMTTLTQVVDHIEAVARENVLLYLQDILACSLSEMAVFVRHVFAKLTVSQQSLGISLLRRVHTSCPTTMEGAATPATAFVARFIEKTLRQISVASRANTRPPSPSMGFMNSTLEEEPVFDFDAFFESVTVPTSYESGLGDQYWSSLLSNLPEYQA